MTLFEPLASAEQIVWQGLARINPEHFTCGYCGRQVGTQVGYLAMNNTAAGGVTAYIAI